MMKNMFAKIKKPDQFAEDTFLIAGLGNPGREYEATRHNVGFMALDTIANLLDIQFSRMQAKAMIAKGQHAGKKVILAKPYTFMNLSGQAVGALTRFYKIPQENIVVVYDDADLDFETVRVRAKGGSAGQKGMKSVIQHLGTEDFARIRIGIDRPPGRMKTPDYVLQDFSNPQIEALPFVLERAANAALTFVAEGINAAMNKFN